MLEHTILSILAREGYIFLPVDLADLGGGGAARVGLDFFFGVVGLLGGVASLLLSLASCLVLFSSSFFFCFSFLATVNKSKTDQVYLDF